MGSRPLCYRCNKYMCLSGCQCRKPAFSQRDVDEEVVDQLFTDAKRRAGRRKLKRAEDTAVLDAVYAPKKRINK